VRANADDPRRSPRGLCKHVPSIRRFHSADVGIAGASCPRLSACRSHRQLQADRRTHPAPYLELVRRPTLLGYRGVRSPYHVAASEAGRDEACVSFEMYTHGSSDGAMPTGWQPWACALSRLPSAGACTTRARGSQPGKKIMTLPFCRRSGGLMSAVIGQ
jgi:hypothetical protein